MSAVCSCVSAFVCAPLPDPFFFFGLLTCTARTRPLLQVQLHDDEATIVTDYEKFLTHNNAHNYFVVDLRLRGVAPCRVARYPDVSRAGKQLGGAATDFADWSKVMEFLVHHSVTAQEVKESLNQIISWDLLFITNLYKRKLTKLQLLLLENKYKI